MSRQAEAFCSAYSAPIYGSVNDRYWPKAEAGGMSGPDPVQSRASKFIPNDSGGFGPQTYRESCTG